MHIRITEQKDLRPVLQMLDASRQFDQNGLEHVRLTLEAYFAGTASDQWLSAISNDRLIGVALCAPEVMANGTWNLLMLWVEDNSQRRGVGSQLVCGIEATLRGLEARLLLVETSRSEDFNPARDFYIKQGFHQQAVISDYYNDGEDKLIFTKKIKSSSPGGELFTNLMLA